MSQYNKTVLTRAGLELAKRVNAGQAKFGITRAVTSADDWSNKTVQDLEKVTTIPNIMQQGTIMDTDEVESNNSVIGVSLCFTNKNLSTGYQIRIIGLYVKEEGQENDFLYAVTTAVTPEYMPDFNDKVLYRFNMQMYLVIGKAQAVNVVINDGASVTHGQFDKYKSEVTANLEKIENAHKEDMSHVVKSASINGGDEILPDEAGKLELVVPAPDLSKYVSLEQLTEALKTKADITAIPDKTATEEGIKQAKELAQEADTKAQSALDNKADKTTVEENLAAKANASDLSALQNSAMQVVDGNSGDDILSFRDEKIRCYNSVQNVKNLPGMSNISWFYVITHTKNGWGNVTVISQDNCYWQNILNGSNWSGWVKHATNVDITDLQNQINTKLNKTDTVNVVNSYDVSNNQNGGLNKWPVTQAWYVDQTALRPFADQINQLKGRRQVDAQDFNNLTDTGTYYVSNPGANTPTGSWGNLLVSNGAGHRTSQMYFPDDGSALYMRELDETTWHDWIQLATTSQVNYAKSTANWDNINGRPQDQINRINVDGPLFKHLTQFNNWGDLFDGYSVNGINATNGSRLVAFRDDTNGSNTVGSNGAGIGFGGSDTKGVLSVAYGSHQARITGGNGTGPTWSEDIAWKSDVSDLRNQVQQLRDNQFEVQTFTDATAAANWEAQRPGHRLAIVNS